MTTDYAIDFPHSSSRYYYQLNRVHPRSNENVVIFKLFILSASIIFQLFAANIKFLLFDVVLISNCFGHRLICPPQTLVLEVVRRPRKPTVKGPFRHVAKKWQGHPEYFVAPPPPIVLLKYPWLV